MFSLICARINGWVNNDEAGDLRRHMARYDVTVRHNVNRVKTHHTLTCLPHWDRDNMADNSQSAFSNRFSTVTINAACSNVTELSSQWSNQQFTSNGLIPYRRQTIIWIKDDCDYWHIYVSLGRNNLIYQTHGSSVFQQGRNLLILYNNHFITHASVNQVSRDEIIDSQISPVSRTKN